MTTFKMEAAVRRKYEDPAEVAGFAVLSAFAFRRSNTFFRLALLSLVPYGGVFFVKG